MPRYTARISKHKQEFVDNAIDEIIAKTEETVAADDRGGQVTLEHLRQHRAQIRRILSGTIAHLFSLTNDEGLTKGTDLPVQMLCMSMIGDMIRDSIANMESGMKFAAGQSKMH